MKKIIPFNNVLKFNTDVYEITSISLEPEIKKESNAISGVFLISGEYKITDAMLEKEKFNFELPFDIALTDNYNIDSLEVDIDDFRYELIDKNNLKVNIDMYVDGEIIKQEELFTEEELRNLTSEPLPSENNQELPKEKEEEKPTEPTIVKIQERLDLLDEMLNKKEPEEEQKDDIFNGLNEEEKYVTYRVYRVLENDTLDKIIEKYSVTKDELSKYNDIEDIKPGDKLIIPSNDQ